MSTDYNPYQAPAAAVTAGDSDADALVLATPGQRFAARFLDTLVLWATFAPAIFVVLVGDAMDSLEGGDELLLGAGITMSGVAMLGLLVYNLSLLKQRGQTLGKKWLRIHIVDDYGQLPPLWKIVLIRILANGLLGSVVPFYSLIDPLLIFAGEQRRCVHDHLCGTRVVADLYGGDELHRGDGLHRGDQRIADRFK